MTHPRTTLGEVTDRLLTPSKITAWLDCAHFLTLQHEVDAGTRTVEFSPFGEMAQLLLDKGLEHEAAVLDGYRAQGLTVFEVPERDRDGNESFAHWVERVGNPMADGHDVDLPDAVRARRDPWHRRLPRAHRRSRHRRGHLRAGRRQARPQRGEAGPRAPAVLLRRGDRRAHRRSARARAHRARLRRGRDDPGRRRAPVLATSARSARQAGRRAADRGDVPRTVRSLPVLPVRDGV